MVVLMSLRIPRELIRKSLNLFGYDLVLDQRSLGYRLAPDEADKYLWLSSLNINTVLDIGANTGEFAQKIRGILPDTAIFSFEPLGDVFRELQRNFQGLSNFKAFNFALGDANCQMTIFRNKFSPSSSLLSMTEAHKQDFPFTAAQRTETVEVKPLDDIFPDLKVKENILIKMDVQGYEDKVIKGGEKAISRSRLLIVETSFKLLYAGQPLFGEIYDSLVQRGFKYIGSWGQLASPSDGSVLQADAMFLKN